MLQCYNLRKIELVAALPAIDLIIHTAQVYEPKHFAALKAGLADLMPHSVRHDTGGWVRFHNGLCFFSKYPIVSSTLSSSSCCTPPRRARRRAPTPPHLQGEQFPAACSGDNPAWPHDCLADLGAETGKKSRD